jgi:signal peptidase I
MAFREWGHKIGVAARFVTGAAIGGYAFAGFSHNMASVAEVTGASMHPTINPHLPPRSRSPSDKRPGEWMLIESFSQRTLGRIQRGDVVWFVAPDNPRRGMIKRVIALPGDEVRLLRTAKGSRGSQRTLIVPNGRFWAEGDNPAADELGHMSCDSNDPNVGPVPIGLLRGRVVGVVWPPSRFGVMMERREAPPGRLVRISPKGAEPSGWRKYWNKGLL